MTRGKKCCRCGKTIGREEIAVHIPEVCDKDVGTMGWFHRDCGIFTEMSEDGFLLVENIERMFKIMTDVLTDWSDPEPIEDHYMPLIHREMENMGCAVREYLATFPEVEPS